MIKKQNRFHTPYPETWQSEPDDRHDPKHDFSHGAGTFLIYKIQESENW
jgi:hypothetical protein